MNALWQLIFIIIIKIIIIIIVVIIIVIIEHKMYSLKLTYSVSEWVKAQFCIVFKPIDNVFVEPSTFVLKSLRKVPVEKGDHRSDIWIYGIIE